MRIFRSFLTILCFGGFGIGGFIIGTIIFPITTLFALKQKQLFSLTNTIHYAWIFFIKVLIFLRLISLKVSPKSNPKEIKGTIIVANHPTLLDIVLLISIIPNSVCIVKNSLSKNFFIKRIVQRIYLINHENPDIFLQKANEFLSKGLNIIIFPEGTRTDFSQKTHKLHRGFAHLAIKSHAAILPIKITCSPRILGKNQKWYDIGTKTANYHIQFMSPISVQKKTRYSEHQQSQLLTKRIYLKLF